MENIQFISNILDEKINEEVPHEVATMLNKISSTLGLAAITVGAANLLHRTAQANIYQANKDLQSTKLSRILEIDAGIEESILKVATKLETALQTKIKALVTLRSALKEGWQNSVHQE